jgi:A/G-specific adenine glycosylase
MDPSAFPPSAPLLAPLAPWFEAGRRVLPWRAGDLDRPHPDPYAVLVSEIMLQQTQVATVIPYFQRWMQRLPDLAALAAASDEEIHGLWAGLGYYRRARNLQAAARILAERGWPGDLPGLLELPGFGPYTAAAVAAQAFQWPTPALDGNGFRVSARLLALAGDPRPLAPALRAWLVPALAAHGPSRLTQALMELGATLCAPQPRCASCPLREACAGHRLGIAASIPPAQPRAKVTAVELHLLALASPGGWLLRRPGGQGLLAGLWSWPWIEVLAPGPSLAAETALPYAALEGRAYPGWVQVYSHRRETVHPLRLDLAASPEPPAGLCWVPPAELAGLAMGRRDQRLRELLDGPGRPPLPAQWAAAAAILKG